MSAGSLRHATPPGVAAVEQLRVVGLSMRREMLVVAAALLGLLILAPMSQEIMLEIGPLLLPTDLGPLAFTVGIVPPLLVWRREAFFGESTLWLLPVEHTAHARAKVAAGWLWLMGVVGMGVAVLIGLILIGHGTDGFRGMVWFATDVAAARAGTGGLEQIPWATPVWGWAHPFFVATCTYLGATAILLGLRRPFHWAIGGWIVLMAIGLSAEVTTAAWGNALLSGYDVAADGLVTGGHDTRQVWVTLPTGRAYWAFTELPTFSSWLSSIAPWTLGTFAACWLATRRSRQV
ncbi:MAG: hypothetical protein AAF389_05400 [Gemmatimonadota bacterium]